MKSFTYCLTINNPRVGDIMIFDAYKSDILYGVIGHEGFNKTNHLQVTLVFKTPKGFMEVKNMFPRAHIEPLRTTLLRAANYCKKEANFTEIGNLSEAEQFLTNHSQSVIKERGDLGGSITPNTPFLPILSDQERTKLNYDINIPISGDSENISEGEDEDSSIISL